MSPGKNTAIPNPQQQPTPPNTAAVGQGPHVAEEATRCRRVRNTAAVGQGPHVAEEATKCRREDD